MGAHRAGRDRVGGHCLAMGSLQRVPCHPAVLGTRGRAPTGCGGKQRTRDGVLGTRTQCTHSVTEF